MNQFQESLQDLLVEHNLSRLALSKKLNISSETIDGYFNKNLYPDINIAKNMAKFFNCSLQYLFGLTDDPSIKEKNNLSFIDTLTILIKQSGKSVYKTMKELKISEYNYYRWKKGTKPLTSTIIYIADYFKVTVDYLAGE